MKKMPLPAVVAAVVIAGAIGLGLWVWQTRSRLPDGFTVANGRIEVTRVDVASKVPGRVLEMRPEKGDMVDRGAVVAVLDSADLRARLVAARATVVRAGQGILKAQADVASAKASLELAEVELKRSSDLVDRAVSAQAMLDQRRAQRDVAAATLQAAEAAVGDAIAARDVAQADVDLIAVQIDDTTLTAPVAGRVEYRLIEPGAVIGAGTRVATLLDPTDVTMAVFVPTRLVGRIALGDEARIVLDAATDWVIPADVSFVASEAQFTPKTVETADERVALMYRVEVRIDPKLTDRWRAWVKAGLTGNVWLRTDPRADWPANLAVHLPEPPGAAK